MYESKHKPLLPKKDFYKRIFRNFLLASVLLGISLFIGVAGYHWSCGLGWTDSLLNASMILTGMGPVNVITTMSGKLFASAYAIFSGVAFLTTIGVVIAPILHRLMHRFHIADEE